MLSEALKTPDVKLEDHVAQGFQGGRIWYSELVLEKMIPLVDVWPRRWERMTRKEPSSVKHFVRVTIMLCSFPASFLHLCNDNLLEQYGRQIYKHYYTPEAVMTLQEPLVLSHQLQLSTAPSLYKTMLNKRFRLTMPAKAAQPVRLDWLTRSIPIAFILR